MTSLFAHTRFGRFAYEDVGSSDSTVVLLHGGAGNLRAWDGVVRNLSQTIRCISLDLPAHGKTPIDQLGFPDLNHAIREFCQKLPVKQPFLIGHSYGGLVAATTALAYAGHVKAVMAIDPYLSNREVQRSYKNLSEALDELRDMKWPWEEVGDLEREVERCLSNLDQPSRYPESSKAMIRRGYRLQESGVFVRYPRREDEMKGVEANWSIDVDQVYRNLPCPLSIVIATQGLGSIDQRRALLSEYDTSVNDFEHTEFECRHDIPGFMPEELSNYIKRWLAQHKA